MSPSVLKRRHVHVAEFPNALDVVVIDQNPVHTGLQTGRDSFAPGLPVTDGVVGFQPYGTCHAESLVGTWLERGGIRNFSPAFRSRTRSHSAPFCAIPYHH